MISVGGAIVRWAESRGIWHEADPSAKPMVMVLLPLPGLVTFVAYRLRRRAVVYVLNGR